MVRYRGRCESVHRGATKSKKESLSVYCGRNLLNIHIEAVYYNFI